VLTENLSSPFILVVEDDEDHAELIRLSFEEHQHQYRLRVVECMRDAALALSEAVPHLVLADYRLPDGGGNELVALVAGRCPVIVMTSHGNEQVAAATLKAGATDYLVKSPETFSSLPQVVMQALQEWEVARERRKTYEAIARGKQEWEQTFDAVPDLICIIDMHHSISRANRALAARLGMKKEELHGRKCYELFHGRFCPPEDCLHFKMVRDGRQHTEESSDYIGEGSFDITVAPLFDADGRITACVHVARDITERKKSEQERLALEHNLQQTQKLESLGVLAGGIAHDFNNILMIILGRCMLAKDRPGLDEDSQSHFQQIEVAAHRAAELCRQMLTYAGRSPLVQTQLDISLLVDDMVKMLTSAMKKNVTFQVQHGRDLPVIDGDKAQIQQVMMNLIINAAESMYASQGTVRVAVIEAVLLAGHSETDFLGNVIPAGAYVCLEVADSGCGMDEETQKRVFEPFYTTKLAGRGLGMSAVLGIMKSHSGALQLSSEPGVGTTFRLFFPVAACGKAAALSGGESQRPPKHGGVVLLVDDESELREIGAQLLTALGFTAITAANGREALEKYRTDASCAVTAFLDLIMPEMGGVETYHALRAIAPTLPIAICSGYDSDEISSTIADDPRAEFLQKPFGHQELSGVLSRFLDAIDVAP